MEYLQAILGAVIILFAALAMYGGGETPTIALLLGAGLYLLCWPDESQIKVKFQRLHENSTMPKYGTEGAACFDIYASESVGGFGRVIVPTGLAMEIPKGYALFLKPRSGLAFNAAVHAFGGTIDSDYRGELKVLVTHENPLRQLNFKVGDRIAQGMILPVPRTKFKEVKALSKTKRGDDGFGSTGI